MGLLIFGAFALLLILGVPIAFSLLAAGTLGILVSPGGADILPTVPQEIFRSLNSFPLLTIPLFIFLGTLMAQGGVASRLMELARVSIGRGRGGLAGSIVVSTMFFHGISGSSTADTAAIGRVTLPELERQGYPRPFSTALLAASGATATLVPPTVDLIIIGTVANISIAGLFAAGILPAIINGTGLIVVVVYLSRKRGYGLRVANVGLWAFVTLLLKALPALVLVVIILGGILAGVFTPTEASAVAVAWGLFISLAVYRTLKIRMLPSILRATVELTGIVMLVIAMSAVLSYSLTVNGVPQAMADAVTSLSHRPAVFLLLVQLMFFITGTVMDGVPAILILMPILTPIALDYGVNPIHFGILVEANVALHLAMPPVGLCLYAACAVSKLPLERVIRPLVPLIAVLVATMLVITYVEAFSLIIPNLLHLNS